MTQKNKNILLFCDLYVSLSNDKSVNMGGVELFIRNLSKNLIKEGYGVTIVSSKYPETLPDYEVVDGIGVYRFNFALPYSLLSFFSIISDLKKIINRHDISIINLQFASSNSLFATLLSKLTKLPLISSLHGNDVQHFPKNSIVQRQILKFTLRNSTIVITNSKALLEQSKEFCSDFKGVVIPSPIEMEDYTEQSTTNKKYIFSMGRFEYKKGFDVLIKSFEFMKDEDVELWIAGKGAEFYRCMNLVYDFDLVYKVKLLGYRERRDIIKLYKECLFFVLPARKAPCDRTMLEAMAAGKAIIGTDVDGVPEMVKSDIGIVVPPENPKALADAMITLLHDNELRRKYEVNGRLRVQKLCNWDRITGMYIKEYQKIMEIVNEKI